MTVLDIDLDNVKSIEEEEQATDDRANDPTPEVTAPEAAAEKKKGKATVTA